MKRKEGLGTVLRWTFNVVLGTYLVYEMIGSYHTNQIKAEQVREDIKQDKIAYGKKRVEYNIWHIQNFPLEVLADNPNNYKYIFN